MRLLIPVYYCLLVLVLACCSPTDVGPVNNYPAATRSFWYYSCTDSVFNFRPTKPVQFNDWITYSNARVEILGRDTMADGKEAMKFKETTDLYGTRVNYYRRSGDTLLLIAHAGYNSNSALLKGSSGHAYVFGGHRFRTVGELCAVMTTEAMLPASFNADTIIYEATPPRVLLFPLSVGKEWTMRQRMDTNGVTVNKKVIGSEVLTMPPGLMPVFKIQWFWDVNNDGVWDSDFICYDYVGDRGMVKRDIMFKNVVITTSECPDGIGLVDVLSEKRLNSFMIY